MPASAEHPHPGPARAFAPEVALASLQERFETAGGGRLRHRAVLPERPAVRAPWPEWVDPSVYAAFAGTGVRWLWSHQRQAADLAWAGEHVVMATGTASGKSLGYQAPVLSAVVQGMAAPTGRGATALYLSPTKALAGDQLTRLESLALPGLRAATYDGDTATDERRWIRDHAHLVLSNPDLVHHSMLPGHRQWAPFLRALRYVVIDECHVYKGVFGSNVALLLRRLRRVCARYGSDPVFVLASATVSAPAEHASALIGMPVTSVTDDGSPRAATTFALWEPGEKADGSRRSATSEAADLMADLVGSGVQTLAFARSRAGVEALASAARRRLEEEGRAEAAASISAYRGGYLPEERRALESGLRSGAVTGLAATTALELGVDVSGLDAVLLAGWPGTRASLWQQAGRAGRSGSESLAVFVAADDPLDCYLLDHPESVLGQPVERTVIDPTNPHLLAPHLAAAAAELPLTEADLPMFGDGARGLLDVLVQATVLRRRASGWFWARADRASDHVSLRGAGGLVSIAERDTGRVVGTIDDSSALVQVHQGAVHVHQGETYVVTELDLENSVATVVRGDPGWSTHAQVDSAFDIVGTERTSDHGPLRVSFGPVQVHSQATSFLRRLPSGEVIGRHPLDLPRRTLPTKAVWWTLPEEVLAAVGIDEMRIPGALHAAEHAAIGMLPLVATSDRWDVGGVSTALHPDTGLPTVMVYDGHRGGAGFAQRAFDAFATWTRATRDAVARCGCSNGCPACVQSPKCGNGNEPLDKAGAVTVLNLLLAHAAPGLTPEQELLVAGGSPDRFAALLVQEGRPGRDAPSTGGITRAAHG